MFELHFPLVFDFCVDILMIKPWESLRQTRVTFVRIPTKVEAWLLCQVHPLPQPRLFVLEYRIVHL